MHIMEGSHEISNVDETVDTQDLSIFCLLIKKSNILSITLKLVLSTLQKHKKCYFYFKTFSFSFLNRGTG